MVVLLDPVVDLVQQPNQELAVRLGQQEHVLVVFAGRPAW